MEIVGNKFKALKKKEKGAYQGRFFEIGVSYFAFL